MEYTETVEMEQLLFIPIDLDLTLNDLRILVMSLNGLAYFGRVNGENYLDREALELKERLENEYLHLVPKHCDQQGPVMD